MIELTPHQIETWVASNFKYKKRSAGRQLNINNPFDGDTDFHFWISTIKAPLKKGKHKGKVGYWVFDFRPGAYAGSLVKFVMEYKNITYFQAISELTGMSKGDLRTSLRQMRKTPIIEEKEEGLTLPAMCRPLIDPDDNKLKRIALNYLASRGIDRNKVRHYALQYTPTTIVFPYLEYDIIVYWQEREILNKKFNFPDAMKTGLNKTDFIFGFDHVDPNDDVVVVESIFNCMSIGHNCVATGGATISGVQPKKIAALSPKTIILAPDNDDAGKKSLISNYYLLKNTFTLAYCLPPPDIDWNDLDRDSGIGTARRYLEKNVKYLKLSDVLAISAQLGS